MCHCFSIHKPLFWWGVRVRQNHWPYQGMTIFASQQAEFLEVMIPRAPPSGGGDGFPKILGSQKNCKIHGTGMFIPTLSNKNQPNVGGGTLILDLAVSCLFCLIRLLQVLHTWYAMDGFCTCDDVRATEWTASVHTLHMPKPSLSGHVCHCSTYTGWYSGTVVSTSIGSPWSVKLRANSASAEHKWSMFLMLSGNASLRRAKPSAMMELSCMEPSKVMVMLSGRFMWDMRTNILCQKFKQPTKIGAKSMAPNVCQSTWICQKGQVQKKPWRCCHRHAVHW